MGPIDLQWIVLRNKNGQAVSPGQCVETMTRSSYSRKGMKTTVSTLESGIESL